MKDIPGIIAFFILIIIAVTLLGGIDKPNAGAESLEYKLESDSAGWGWGVVKD